MAVASAIAVHAALIGLVHFDVLKPRSDRMPPSLDVILVDWATEKPPDEADFLAQATQRGGGENPERERPAEAMPLIEEMPVEAPEPQPEVAGPAEPTELASELIAVRERDAPAPETREEAEPSLQQRDARQLIEQSLAMARRNPDLVAETRDFPEQPRRRFVSANTREHLYAGYMRAWVSKVERVGNLNYPEQARRQNIEGSLVLSVDVLPDGSVGQINVLRSSGHALLDEAAVRIVRLSSPFAPLPEDILAETDILTITRTWQFSASRGLGSH